MPVSRDSIAKVTARSARNARAHLKALGIDVPDVDGASDDAGLSALQELQAIEGALEAHAERKQAASVAPGTSIPAPLVSKPAAKGE